MTSLYLSYLPGSVAQAICACHLLVVSPPEPSPYACIPTWVPNLPFAGSRQGTHLELALECVA